MSKLSFEMRPLGAVFGTATLTGAGSLVERVYGLVRRAIIDLSLPPGYALVEQDVAAVLGVSKTPVREAIIRLAREGLVQVIPKSGSYVTPVRLDYYLDACFIRIQLEVGCVRRLATRGVRDDGQIRLASIIARQREALRDADEAAFFAADEALHKSFFDLAELSGVWNVLDFAKAELDRVRHLKRRFGIRQRELVLEEHVAIVDAVVARQPDAAAAALLNNIGGIEDQIAWISSDSNIVKTIDELNNLVALDHRKRNGRIASKD